VGSKWEKNPEFWRSAYQSHGSAILAYLKVRTPALEDAEDLLQETFVKAIHAANSLSDITKIRSFLFSIAHNLLVNQLQKKRPAGSSDIELVAHTMTPEQELASNSFKKQLDFMIKTLTPSQQKAFESAVLNGMPYRDISRMTGWPLSTVKINVYRARKRIISGMKGYF